MFHSRKVDVLVLILICLLAFWWRLGVPGLIDPDEPFYAQTAHEMIQTGDWMTPHIYGAPQFEKPVLYYWLVAASFKLFGESESAGRLPGAASATALVLITWLFATRIWNARAAFLAGLVLATGLEFCVMSRLMLTDVPLALFLAGSIFSSCLALHTPGRRDVWLFVHAVCTGLAVLTKGPIGSLVPLFTALSYSVTSKTFLPFRNRGYLLGVAVAAMIVIPWYALMFAQHGQQFWEEFFVRDNFLRFIRAEHPANNHFWYYPGLLLLGSIPWMPSVVLAALRSSRSCAREDAIWFQWSWLLSSLVFLTLAQSKLPSYALYLFIPLALIVGRTLDLLLQTGFESTTERWIVGSVAILQCAAALAALMFKVVRPFQGGIALFCACLGISVGCLLFTRFLPWIFSSAAASLSLLAVSLSLEPGSIELQTSAKPLARVIKAERQDDEPLVSSKSIIRGLIYYTGCTASVLARSPQPFWAAHPLQVVLWRKGLDELLRSHPSALCAFRREEWNSLQTAPAFREREAYREIGGNVIVRARSVQITTE